VRKKVKAIFISDIHLGTRFAQDRKALSFLKRYSAETLYLVGDIIDGWALGSSWYWPKSHNDLLREIIGHRNVIYIPGNHDEFLKNYFGQYGNIKIVPSWRHVTAKNKIFLVTHGDDFDLVVKNAKWLSHVGDRGYDVILTINRAIGYFFRKLGIRWSLSAWIKHNVKQVVKYISSYEKVLAAEARRNGARGVICGHMHFPEMRTIKGIRYINCGDFVESNTGVIEELNGKIKIIQILD
jgi:UDP-2,3-diacylglucosamine pyrophosphatase LpxH